MEGKLNKETIKKGLELSLLVSVLALGGLVLFTINEETISKLLSVNTFYLFLALIISCLMWGLGGLRIKLISDAVGEELSLSKAVKIFLVGAFVSNVTPFASGGGPAQVFLLHKDGFSLGKSTTVIVIQFVLRLMFFGLVAPVLFIVFRDLINPGLIPAQVFNLAIGAALLISVVMVYFIWQPKKIKTIVAKLKALPFFKPLLKYERIKKLVNRLYHEVEEFHDSLWQLTKYRKSSLVWAGVSTICYWVLFFVIAPVILLGLGAEPFFLRSFVMQTIFFLILPYIPTPGGSGVAELGFASLFSSFVPAGLVGLLSLVWRFITFYLVLILGGLILLRILAKSAVGSHS
ncbi:lysylphosphatidylglycerol synthase transmembrane domain-containing protein [Halanaerobaculum tunisiense]